MTKIELLADLEGRSFVKELIGDPVDTTPDGDAAICKWYQQNYFEVIQNVAVKKDITFYVVNEGETDEWAAYKDAGPDIGVNTNVIQQWFDEKWLAKVVDQTDPTLNWRVVTTGKEQFGAIVGAIKYNTESGKGEVFGYYCYKDANDDMACIEIDLTDDQVLLVMAPKLR